MEENLNLFDSALSDTVMTVIASPDKNICSFFSHLDPSGAKRFVKMAGGAKKVKRVEVII